MKSKLTFWVFGSGRWSKVVVSQLFALFRCEIDVYIVSARDAKVVEEEFRQFGMPKVAAVHRLKPDLSVKNNYAIVCGKTSLNVENVRAAISVGLNVYVEKPFALETSYVLQLLAEAKQNNVQIYCSNVFYFHEKLHKLLFENTTNEARKNVQKLKFVWIDENTFSKSNSAHKYDPALTACEDILPHLIPLASEFLRTDVIEVKSLEVERLGQRIRVHLGFGSVEVEMHLERNGEARVRELQLLFDQRIEKVEFSSREPSRECLKKSGKKPTSNKLGPLALSLFDFVRSSECASHNVYNNTDHSLKTIELFPTIDKKYIKACERIMLDAKITSNLTFQDAQYLKNELSARLSGDGAYCSYFDRSLNLKLQKELLDLGPHDRKART